MGPPSPSPFYSKPSNGLGRKMPEAIYIWGRWGKDKAFLATTNSEGHHQAFFSFLNNFCGIEGEFGRVFSLFEY